MDELVAAATASTVPSGEKARARSCGQACPLSVQRKLGVGPAQVPDVHRALVAGDRQHLAVGRQGNGVVCSW